MTTRSPSTRRPRLVALVIVTTVALSATACTDDDAAPDDQVEAVDTARPITAEEASRLADALPLNLEDGGAAFRATAPFGVATFVLDGEIDWVNHIGAATVTPTLADEDASEPFDISFNRSIVFEEVPGLRDAMAANSQPPAGWIARPLDAETAPLDVILTLIDASASTQRDNPVLLQSNGAEWVGEEELSEATADIFDLGRTRYWIDRDSGRLLRSEADLEMTNSTITIDWSDPGPRTVDVPAADDIVDLAEVVEIYSELRSTGG